MNKIILKIFAVGLLFLGGYFVIGQVMDKKSYQSEKTSYQDASSKKSEVKPEAYEVASPEQPGVIKNDENQETNSIDSLIKLEVPFVVQAPFGNWDDPVFQDACEESSIVMAMGWVNGVSSISPEEAQRQIKKIVDFENSNFGYSTDADVLDVQKIIQQFFQHAEVDVYEDISMEDIESELQKGHLILVPAFGQALKNPNYTSPGPVAHMLPIIGYDPATEEFITHDPGTRRGSGFRYDKNVLFEAIWAYPSGNEKLKAPSGSLKKSMVVVEKS